MTETPPRPGPDEIARRGDATIDRLVRPRLGPGDLHKFLAVDIDSGDYELDDDDYAAVERLRVRRPGGLVYLARVGHPAAYALRGAR